MPTLVVLYRQPEDPAEFDRLYFGQHVPLVHRVPHLAGVRVGKVTAQLAGEPALYLRAELDFASQEDFEAASQTPEFQALGADVASWGADRLATILLVDDVPPDGHA